MNEAEVLELVRVAGEWLFDRRERLEKHDHEGIAFVWLGLSEIESILRAFTCSTRPARSPLRNACSKRT